MRFNSPKILLVFILFIVIIILGIFTLFFSSNKPTQLPVQKITSTPTPPYYQTPVSPLAPTLTPYNQLDQQQKNDLQMTSDQNYQNKQNQILAKYPWYLKLPFQDKYYFVYFDPPSETFIATIYPQKSFSISLDTQIKSLKDSVVKRINTLGADAEKYNIIWEITAQ